MASRQPAVRLTSGERRLRLSRPAGGCANRPGKRQMKRQGAGPPTEGAQAEGNASQGRYAMKTRAAVVYEPGKPIEIEELELNGPPGDGEVLIRYTHAGLCHSDVHVQHGDLPARLPMVLGHEG